MIYLQGFLADEERQPFRTYFAKHEGFPKRCRSRPQSPCLHPVRFLHNPSIVADAKGQVIASSVMTRLNSSQIYDFLMILDGESNWRWRILGKRSPPFRHDI